MPDLICCFRCGESLATLSLPLSRRDMCPACSVHVHVCRMCSHFDESVVGKCREEDAEEVLDKEKANFCEWFQASAGAFDSRRAGQQQQARSELDSLFGEDSEDRRETGADVRAAEDLFK